MLAGGTNHTPACPCTPSRDWPPSQAALALPLAGLAVPVHGSRAVSTGRASTRVSRPCASPGCSLGPRQQSWVRVALPDKGGVARAQPAPRPQPQPSTSSGASIACSGSAVLFVGPTPQPRWLGTGVKARALGVLLIPRYLPDKPKLRPDSAESLTCSYTAAKAAAPCCRRGPLLLGTSGLRAQPGCGAARVHGAQGDGHGAAQPGCSRRALRCQVGS